MGKWLRHGAVVVGVLMSMAPSMGWIGRAWASSPQDQWGPLYAVVAVIWALCVVWALDRVNGARACIDGTALPLVFLALLCALFGVLFDINVLIAVAGVIASWALAWGCYGAVTGLLLLPSLVCLLLALPTVSYLIDVALRVIGLGSLPVAAVAGFTVLLMLGAGAWGLRSEYRGRFIELHPMATTYSVLGLIALAGLSLAFRPPVYSPSLRLDEQQWAFGEWLGAEVPVSPSERGLFNQYRLSKRAYATADGDLVAVLIVHSDNVHELHPPEYCLTGSGWQIAKRGTALRSFAGRSVTVAELLAERDDDLLAGIYWYSSDSRSTTDLVGLRLRHRLMPQEPFTLYFATAVAAVNSSSAQLLAEFLSQAPWQR